MTKAKKYICILLIIITVLLSFSGCVAPGNQAYNNTETVKFLGYLKQDTESSFGKKSAVYDGRIYFQGQAGIYSMLPDGSDMQKEADAKDIRKIQITEDKMFFLDFTRIDNNHNGKIRAFDLFKQADGKKYIMSDSKYENIWDFYCTKDGDIFILEIDTHFFISRLETILHMNGQSFLQSNPITEVPDDDNKSGLYLIRFSEFFVSGYTYYPADLINEYHENGGFSEGILPDDFVVRTAVPVTVYDNISEQIVLDNSEIYFGSDEVVDFDGYLDLYDIFDVRSDGYILAKHNQIIHLDPDGKTILNEAEIENVKEITFYLSMGDKAYIVAEDGSGVQSVYLLDVNTFEVTPVYSCDAGIPLFGMQAEKILSVTEDELVTVKDDTVKLHRIAGKEVLFEREIKLPQSIVKNSCKTDRAGDWLFVYDYNEENTADELIFRVNIKTSEIF